MYPTAAGQPAVPGALAKGAAHPPTRRHATFDVGFGVVLPIVCLVFDPGVLRSDFGGGALLGAHAVAAYIFIVPAMVGLACWLLWQRAAILLAGPLLAGALVALMIGLVIGPLGIMIAVAGIGRLSLADVGFGLLGLVPIGTAVAFRRSGLCAFRAACRRHSRFRVSRVAVLLGLATLIVPFVVESHLNGKALTLVQAAQYGDARDEAAALSRWKPLTALVDST